jgi:hypothetical protein
MFAPVPVTVSPGVQQRDVAQVRDDGVFQLLGALHRDRDRDVLQPLFAPLRGHDDFLEARRDGHLGR